MKILKNKVYKYRGKTYVELKYELDGTPDIGECQDRLEYTAPWMLKHFTTWADFSHCYTLELFCDSLEALAHGLKRWNHLVLSKRYYRRCLFAAKQLRAAYNYEEYNDVSYKALTDSVPFKLKKWTNNSGLQHTIMVHDYSKLGHVMKMSPKEYYSKMFKVINKRCKGIRESKIANAWAYIHKHIESFWD